MPLADSQADCEQALGPVGSDPSRPIVVLVHGVGGDGPEMEDVVPRFDDSRPRALFMLRWVPYDERDAIASRLAAGISRIAACVPDSRGRIIVIAHSAGGVLTGFAAGRLRLPAGEQPWVHLITVASPLAGTVRRTGNADGSQEAVFMLDLGTRILAYPAAARGVHVVHLRTHAPADPIMQNSGDLFPNDVHIGVPGAAQVELPGELGHSDALVFVAREMVAGRGSEWLQR